MLPVVVAILLVTFTGAGKGGQSELALFPDLAACEAARTTTVAKLEADPEVAGYSFTCVPAAVKVPGTKS